MQDKFAEKGISNILCVSCAPGLAATNLQATTADKGGGKGLQSIMRFCQSAEDGALPLLHAAIGADVESGDFIVRSLLGWLKRNIDKVDFRHSERACCQWAWPKSWLV